MADTEYLREFDFLPNLPKSNLDDRTFNELVQECILRIPRYCPEWTNHNPGDPGITLVELFAWLTDQMLFRFNQVPRRYYVAFLELLGIRLASPVPAAATLTFYLTKAQASAKHIPVGTEVATIRTESEEAVVFTTTKDLIIGQPKIQHLLTAIATDERPPSFANDLTPSDETGWNMLGNLNLFETSQPHNCFYVVLEATESLELAILNPEETNLTQPQNAIAGNILAFTFRGTVAGTTGINPEDPPRKWEAWNGEKWVDILRDPKENDQTKGFSFHTIGQPQQGADVILHLPQEFPVTEFSNYHGHWIRCVYTQVKNLQTHYDRSPQISSIAVRAIGGQIDATECVSIKDELLGVSDGKPGQTFQLQGYPVLERVPGEYIQVISPGGETHDWEEVKDFANSGPEDRHYIIDSRTGSVQFGPLVREPNALLERIEERTRLQPWGKKMPTSSSSIIRADLAEDNDDLEWQYGKRPPINAEIRITSYRVGGGTRGNVQVDKLTVLKTAIPYVKKVTNYQPARGGKEGESLEQAVMRVPQILRTSKTAVTAEDFQNVAERHRAIYRAYCPPSTTPGEVRLLIVPDCREYDSSEAEFRRQFPTGINPDVNLTLNTLGREALEKLEADLNEHKSLGIQVKLHTPEYVSLKLIAEIFLEAKYNNIRMTEIQSKILTKLYYFLNPITGGFDKKGWKIGVPVKISEAIAFLQDIPEVRYVGNVQMFSIRKHPIQQQWYCSEIPELLIDPGKSGLICFWENDRPDHRSEIRFLAQ